MCSGTNLTAANVITGTTYSPLYNALRGHPSDFWGADLSFVRLVLIDQIDEALIQSLKETLDNTQIVSIGNMEVLQLPP